MFCAQSFNNYFFLTFKKLVNFSRYQIIFEISTIYKIIYNKFFSCSIVFIIQNKSTIENNILIYKNIKKYNINLISTILYKII